MATVAIAAAGTSSAPEVAAPPPTELVRPCLLGTDDCFLDADGHTRRASVAYAAMRPRLPAHPWQALAWEATFLTAGVIWYWAEKQTNAVDWDYSSWIDRFSADAYRYDNNEFPMNFLFHPMAGSAFYGVARANELGILPSAGYAFATSFSWEYLIEFREKVKIEMAVSEPFVEPTIKAILSSARTGEVGDGKIFVQPIERVIRIRTGEADNAALTPVTADEVQRNAIRGTVESGK